MRSATRSDLLRSYIRWRSIIRPWAPVEIELLAALSSAPLIGRIADAQLDSFNVPR